MIVLTHLMRGHRFLYACFWAVMAVVFAGFMVTFEVFGPWIADDEHVSAWGMAGLQAPGWFLFVMGIIWATTSLPVAVAHGITRREFCAGAGAFALFSSVLFGLLMLAGFGLEYLVYQANGVMAELTRPYPLPTWGQGVDTVLGCLGFVLAGWLIGLCFYRLPVWWAIVLTPIAGFPVGGGIYLPFVDEWPGGTAMTVVTVVAAAVAGYLMAGGVPLRPKKA